MTVAGFLAALLWATNSRHEAALGQLRQECAQLRQEVVDRESAASQLQAALESFHRVPAPGEHPNQGPPGQKADTLDRSGKVPANPAEQKRKQAAATLDGLNVAWHEQADRLAGTRTRVNTLAADLSIPENVALVSPGRGMDTPSLSAYRPYFEAKKELDFQQVLLDKLRMQILAQEVEQTQQEEDPLQALRKTYAAQAEKVSAARAHFADLLVSLNVSDEIAVMDSAKGLTLAELAAYRPLFEAKREKEFLEAILDKLRRQIFAQEIEAKMPKP